MQACAHCGYSNQANPPHCAGCGRPLSEPDETVAPPSDAAAPPPGKPVVRPASELSQTMMGMPAPRLDTRAAHAPSPNRVPGGSTPPQAQVTQSHGGRAASGFDPKRTLLGGISQGPAAVGLGNAPGQSSRPPVSGQSAPRTTPVTGTPAVRRGPLDTTAVLHPGADGANVGNTLLGMAAPSGMPTAATPPGSSATPNPTHPSAPEHSFATTLAHGQNPGSTMLGLAPPQVGEAQAPAVEPAPQTAAASPPQSQHSHQPTLQGMAAPSVGPVDQSTQPSNGSGTNGRAPSAESTSTGSTSVMAPTVPAFQHSEAADVPLARSRRRGGIALLALAGLLLVGVLSFLMLWDVPAPLQARVESDGRGHDLVELVCDDCPRGSKVTYGKQQTEFDGRSAKLQLDAPLRIGNNDLTVALERPGIGRDEAVRLQVPVHYRVQADASSLTETPPQLTVVVQAAPDSEVQVNGTAVPMSEGRGTRSIDVSGELTGPAADVRTLSREVQYVVTTATGPQQGRLTVELPITPLVVDTPSESWLTDEASVTLSGRTSPNARVQVNDGEVQADTEGRFEQHVALPSIGTHPIDIRALAADHAPRLVRHEAERTADLRAEAKLRRRAAKRTFAQVLLAATGDAPQAIALEGRVHESRVQAQSTVLILDVSKGCSESPCLARVLASQPLEVDRGARIEVFGTTHGTIESPFGDQALPVVTASFILR